MNKLLLFLLLLLFTSFHLETKNKLPKGFWKNVFFSERGYLKTSNGNSLNEIIEYRDSDFIIDTSIIDCGFYIDDTIIFDYCFYEGKRWTQYFPIDDVRGDFSTYLSYKIKNDTINLVPYTNLNTIFKYCNDTLVLQGRYRTLKFVKDLDQLTPVFIMPDSVYYPYNP